MPAAANAAANQRLNVCSRQYCFHMSKPGKRGSKTRKRKGFGGGTRPPSNGAGASTSAHGMHRPDSTEAAKGSPAHRDRRAKSAAHNQEAEVDHCTQDAATTATRAASASAEQCNNCRDFERQLRKARREMQSLQLSHGADKTKMARLQRQCSDLRAEVANHVFTILAEDSKWRKRCRTAQARARRLAAKLQKYEVLTPGDELDQHEDQDDDTDQGRERSLHGMLSILADIASQEQQVSEASKLLANVLHPSIADDCMHVDRDDLPLAQAPPQQSAVEREMEVATWAADRHVLPQHPAGTQLSDEHMGATLTVEPEQPLPVWDDERMDDGNYTDIHLDSLLQAIAHAEATGAHDFDFDSAKDTDVHRTEYDPDDVGSDRCASLLAMADSDDDEHYDWANAEQEKATYSLLEPMPATAQHLQEGLASLELRDCTGDQHCSPEQTLAAQRSGLGASDPSTVYHEGRARPQVQGSCDANDNTTSAAGGEVQAPSTIVLQVPPASADEANPATTPQVSGRQSLTKQVLRTRVRHRCPQKMSGQSYENWKKDARREVRQFLCRTFGADWTVGDPGGAAVGTSDRVAAPRQAVVDVLCGFFKHHKQLYADLCQELPAAQNARKAAEVAAVEKMQRHMDEVAWAVWAHLDLTEKGYQV